MYHQPLAVLKLHRKRRRPLTGNASPDRSGNSYWLLVLILSIEWLATEVLADIQAGGYYVSGWSQYHSRHFIPGFGMQRPQQRQGPKFNHDRQSNVMPLFVSSQGENDYENIKTNRFDAADVAGLTAASATAKEPVLSSVSMPLTLSSANEMTEATAQPLELLQTIILQQQRQIDTLLQLLQQQRPSVNAHTAVNGDPNLPNSAPLLFQPLSSPVQNTPNHWRRTQSDATFLPDVVLTQGAEHHPMKTPKVFKAMLFIDGTWLYYSIHERLAKDCSIIQKYGRGWQHRYDIDWMKLPSLLCQTLQREMMKQMKKEATGGSPMEEVQIDLVQSSVYTSYKADTPTTSYRYKLFQELQKANYQVHMMETVGKSEKCVDIQLAVEILHYATLENRTNSYDIALLLTGDKDLMPAIIRARCKGKRVGLVSMRPGCNRALVDTPGLLDFEVIWMEDFLDQLVVPRVWSDGIDMAEVNVRNGSPQGPTSMSVLNKVVYDFIQCSGLPRVSSRDLGRYLKQLSVSGGITLLETMKRYYGGMYQYLSSLGCYNFELPTFTQNTTDHSYWISLTKTPVDGDNDLYAADDLFAETDLTEMEKQFLSTYSVERLAHDRQTLYMHSMERMSNETPGELEQILEYEKNEKSLMGDTIELDDFLETTSQSPDYSSMTLVELKAVCRGMGLAVSGTKATLLSRIQKCLKNEQPLSQPNHNEHQRKVEFMHPKANDEPVALHLKELILEYLHAKGGVANSRMIGRYLAANKASPKANPRPMNALKEMKSKYGNLNTFLATFPDTFIAFRDNRNNNSTDGSGSGDDFGFSIALKQQTDRA